MSLELDLDLLKDRAIMLAKTRKFFAEKKVLEVDCPALNRFPALDANIDSMEVSVSEKTKAYLHTSPEYWMKRLLAEGMGDIYQLSHVYRKSELGSLHQPEFTMVEWYRIHFSLHQILKETIEYISLFIGKKSIEYFTYQELFETYLHINPFTIATEDLFHIAKENDLELEMDRNLLLQGLLCHCIEPKLKSLQIIVVRYFPPSQAALAKIETIQNTKVAMRFEIYYQGIELANAYEELNDAKEQKNRFEKENRIRKTQKKALYPLDFEFLSSLDRLPQCSGVSVGFDRLMLLRHQKETLQEVMMSSFKSNFVQWEKSFPC